MIINSSVISYDIEIIEYIFLISHYKYSWVVVTREIGSKECCKCEVRIIFYIKSKQWLDLGCMW